MGGDTDRKCFENRIALRFEIRLRQSACNSCGDEVHHDCIDDFVGTEARLQQARNGSPCGSAENRRQTRQRNQEPGRKTCECNSGPRCSKRRDRQLSFGADVQQPATETNCDGKPCKDQRRGIEQRVSDAVRPGERAANQEPIGFDGIVANKSDDDSAHDKGRDHGDQREYQLS